jgi:hypothetical protein
MNLLLKTQHKHALITLRYIEFVTNNFNLYNQNF